MQASPTPSQESLVSQHSAEDPVGLADKESDPRSPFVERPFCTYSAHTSDLLDVSWSKVMLQFDLIWFFLTITFEWFDSVPESLLMFYGEPFPLLIDLLTDLLHRTISFYHHRWIRRFVCGTSRARNASAASNTSISWRLSPSIPGYNLAFFRSYFSPVWSVVSIVRGAGVPKQSLFWFVFTIAFICRFVEALVTVETISSWLTCFDLIDAMKLYVWILAL